MSTRRRDMWKLLYDLVNRSERSDLNDVFPFVNDILCKEPSLIQPYSLHEINNRFQNTFVFWLINKFINTLNETSTVEIQLANIKLQQNILTSCLVNRPLLFQRLVAAYVTTVEQLTVDLPVDADEDDCLLEVNAFISSDNCLCEIDANFTFHCINVSIDDIDERLKALLTVLRHALSIGYDIYPQLFVNSLESIFGALENCDFPIKLLCLRYYNAVFKKVHILNSSLETHYELYFQALVIMLEQVPTWLNANCIKTNDVDDLLDIAHIFLDLHQKFIPQLQYGQGILQLAFSMLKNVAQLAVLREMQTQNSAKLHTLASTLIKFMFQILQSKTDIIQDSDELLQLVEKYHEVLCLVAVCVTQQNLTESKHIYQFFIEKLLELFNKDTICGKDLPLLKELLAALNFIEHHQSRVKQVRCLKMQRTLNFLQEQNDYDEFNLFATHITSEQSLELERREKQFLTAVEHNKEMEHMIAMHQISYLMLQSATIRNIFSVDLQLKLVSYLERTLKIVLSTPQRAKSSDERELAFVALHNLCTISIQDKEKQLYDCLKRTITHIMQQLFTASLRTGEPANELLRVVCDNLDNLIASGYISREQILTDFLKSSLNNNAIQAKLLNSIYCTADLNEFHTFKWCSYHKHHQSKIVQIICKKCTKLCVSIDNIINYMEQHPVALMHWQQNASKSNNKRLNLVELAVPLSTTLFSALFKDVQYTFLANHLELTKINADDCFKILASTSLSAINKKVLRLVMLEFLTKTTNFVENIAKFLLKQTIHSLREQQSEQHSEHASQQTEQLEVLDLIKYCAQSKQLNEQWLFHFFKLTFFFLLHPETKVAHEAILCAMEICDIYGYKPIQLWNWYKRDALSLIVRLAILLYLRKGVRLTKSLKAFAKMLGFSCAEEFVCKYYRLLTTMILPYCVKEPQCKGLLVNISKTNRKSISNLMTASFLRIYTHIYLTESVEIGNKCIDLIVKCTTCSLKKLMNTDMKLTVSECLLYFNRNPKFVMRTFQCLLPYEITESQQLGENTRTSEFAKFIADRFLGVITYFESCLSEQNFEKPLKEEALYSLGQIMRFIGAQYVTQFRFKIISMLSFVLTLNDPHLKNICLKIWSIFLHIVNIQELGPSLSRIVAALQPLLEHNSTEVNAIYDFLVLKNDSLLGVYIPDLYFVEDIEQIQPPIRHFVSRQAEILKSNKYSLLDKLRFLYKQICNENVQVRVYALSRLRHFITAQRESINHLVLTEMHLNPLIEEIIEIVLAGCRHEDRNLQLASAKCLGELGAIDPSYLPSNYTFEKVSVISLNIHTDEFAAMALTELCRAYQFQRDTKYVDSFSLAIQETLSMCGISPRENKKTNIWNEMPLRMRQVMEPLLTSCYTGSRSESKCKEHPIFNSSFSRSYDDWAFAWASRLIEFVQTEDTKHLLSSYKPSIRRENSTRVTFLPYIVLHALFDCNEAQAQLMFEEFEAVFNFSSSGVNLQPQYETTGCKEFQSNKYTADTASDERKVKNLNTQYDSLEILARNCTKLCSEQVDFLQRWEREWQRLNIFAGKSSSFDEKYQRINDFNKKFDKLLIAKANYNSGDFARALLYLEQYIEVDTKQRLQEQLSFLIEIYGNLMDADSVEGAVYTNKSNLSLSEEILVNRIVDRPQDTMTCYEQLMSSDQTIHQDHIKGMINCYLRMDTPETALLITDGLWQKLTDHYTDDYFKECKSELLWRLGRYDELQELLEDSVVRRKTTNWNIQCAEAFLIFREPQEMSANVDENAERQFLEKLDNIRSHVLSNMRDCAGNKQNSYAHCYDEVVKLHLLNEVEKNKLLLNQVTSFLSGDITSISESSYLEKVRTFFMDWDARLSVLQPVARVMEPVFCFRRNLLIEMKRLISQHTKSCAATASTKEVSGLIDSEIGKLWIRSAQMYRDAGSLQQAQLSIMKADEYAPPTLFIEKTKLLWEKGDQMNCFKLIEENLERIGAKGKGNIRSLDAIDGALYAEAKYLQATYNAESMNICSELNIKYFKEAILGNRHSEKCYVQLAQYMEKIYESFSRDQKDSDNVCTVIMEIMLNYAKSLRYGFENVYQSLPRLLSIWFDLTIQYATSSNDLPRKMNELILNCANALPVSIFYTALSQLLSRICHPSVEVFTILRTIIIKMIESYPHQSLWMLLPIFKSGHIDRVKRCQVIFTDSRLRNAGFQKLFADFNMFAERLIELTNKEVAPNQTYELSALVKQLPKFFEDPNFSKLLLPFEKYMQASFPITSASSLSVNYTIAKSPNSSSTPLSAPTNPFPHKEIFITGLSEEVTILHSAAKPKKLTIKCSDGNSYYIMVKPKDDLRKDFRLMEFNGLVKRYLHQDSQARHRRLRIRTYAVIPFNDECGLVEWLPNLNSFRSLCMDIYRSRGLGLPDRMLRQCAVPKTETIEKKRNMFVKTLLVKYPPVFHYWFRQRFSTPHSWYEARTAYVKTIAVMSMVGYILGLGDRHGENVLFDETNGDAVHVDFNCLFNQGELFAVPELVPFRLTHNMVFAMGPLGIEGMYRKCCEITLRVLKHESKTLMSVLRPFVYDFVALNRNNKKQPSSTEFTDPKAMEDVRRIEERLKGYVKRTVANSMPLSIEGQINFLINEATNIDNLASMYIGWGAYI